MHHPSELYETLGGAAALATGGLALGALPGLGAAAGAGEGFLAGGAALPGIAPEAAAASGGLEAAGGGFDAAAAGYGTAGLTNAAGEVMPNIGNPLAQGSAGGGTDPGGLFSSMFGSTGNAGAGGLDTAGGTAGMGAYTPTAAPPAQGGWFDTLTSPSQWTLPGVAKGAGVLAAGAGLGMNMLHGNQIDPYQQKLQDSANQLGAQGQVLESYLRTGKLPPALQAQLDQWEAAKKAQIIAGAAARGQPTDPLMNSALAQDLSNLKLQGLAQMAETQVNLLNAGLKETGMSMDAYKTIAQMDQKQQEDLMKAIQNMAMALAGGFGGGGGGGVTLKVA